MSQESDDAKHARREDLSRRLCELMGWEWKTGPMFAGLRKVALGEAAVVGNDKLAEIVARLEGVASTPASTGG